MLPCEKCVYQRDIPGNAHIACAFNWQQSGLKQPKFNGNRLQQQWFLFPFNFDPIWSDNCKGFSAGEMK